MLAPLWKQVRATSYPAPPDALDAWLAAHPQRTRQSSSQLRIHRRPAFITAAVLAFAVLSVGMVPFQHTQSLGYLLTWQISASPDQAPDFLAKHTWIEPSWLSLSMQPGQATLTFLLAYPLSRANVLDLHQTHLASDSTAQRIRVRPIEQTVEQRGYEIAMRYIRVLPDEEPAVVEARLRTHLEALGLAQPIIRYDRQDGQKQIEITTPHQP